MCDFINAHEVIIQIATFGEYKCVMKDVMVIREAFNVERERRQTSREKRSEDAKTRTQRAKALVAQIKRDGHRKEEIEKRLETIFGNWSKQTIACAETKKIIERIEDLSKTEEQFEVWERMRLESKKKQREDRRLNIFWRKNKCFPAQHGGNDETPDVEETLSFWSVNNKEANEGWKEVRDIRGALYEVKMLLRKGRRCRLFDFGEEEFDEVLRCTAPWKACCVDSVYSFPFKKCPPIKKAVFDW